MAKKLTAHDVATIDFETEAIDDRPNYPPKPVGVAIWLPKEKPVYLSWGHPEGNSTTFKDAARTLKKIWANRKKVPILCHHGKFDLEVANVHFDLPIPGADELEDTEFLAFLNDPYDSSLSLKPLAVKHLNMPAEEQADLRDWILLNVPECAGKPKTWRGWGAYIARAPVRLVEPYAKGDVIRTKKLFDKFLPTILAEGMFEGYFREKEFLPVTIEMEQNGMPVSIPALSRSVKLWEASMDAVDAWVRKKLKAPVLDVDSNKDLADALERAGVVHPEEWVTTEKGNRSVAADALLETLGDSPFAAVLIYRAKLANALRNFGRPWLNGAKANRGVVPVQWHQVRFANDRSKKSSGARTGRTSSNPNVQNIPNDPKPSKLPADLKKILCDLPQMRDFVRPPKGFVFFGRDYSQQELRVLAHYEDGELLRLYLDNPEFDIHAFATDKVSEIMGLPRTKEALTKFRKKIKIMGFGLIYGMGIGLLAEMMSVDVETAKRIKEAYLSIFPGLRALDKALKESGRAEKPIKTWGGRRYFAEPPRFINGVRKTFEYKLLNYLIQGSSADCTKQALIQFHKVKDKRTQILLNVHDEILAMAPKEIWKAEMSKLKIAMENVDFDVPMLSDGEWSAQSWAKMKEVA